MDPRHYPPQGGLYGYWSPYSTGWTNQNSYSTNTNNGPVNRSYPITSAVNTSFTNTGAENRGYPNANAVNTSFANSGAENRAYLNPVNTSFTNTGAENRAYLNPSAVNTSFTNSGAEKRTYPNTSAVNTSFTNSGAENRTYPNTNAVNSSFTNSGAENRANPSASAVNTSFKNHGTEHSSHSNNSTVVKRDCTYGSPVKTSPVKPVVPSQYTQLVNNPQRVNEVWEQIQDALEDYGQKRRFSQLAEQMDDEMRKLRQEILEKEAENEDCKDRLNNEIKLLRERIVAREEAVECLEKMSVEMNKMEEENEALKKEIKEKESAERLFVSLKKKHKFEEKHFQDLLNERDQELITLKNEKKERMSYMTVLKFQNLALKYEMKKKKENMEEMNEKDEASKDQIQLLEIQNEQLKRAYDSLHSAFRELEKSENELQVEIKNSNRQLSELKAKDCGSHAKSLESKNEDLKKSLDSMASSLRDMEKSEHRRKSENHDLKRQLAELKSKDQGAVMRSLENQNDELKRSVDSMSSSLRELEKSEHERKIENEDLQKQLSEVKSKGSSAHLGALQRKNEELKKNLESVSLSLREAEKSDHRRKIENQDLARQLADLKSKDYGVHIESLECQNEELRKNLENVTSSLRKMETSRRGPVVEEHRLDRDLVAPKTKEYGAFVKNLDLPNKSEKKTCDVNSSSANEMDKSGFDKKNENQDWNQKLNELKSKLSVLPSPREMEMSLFKTSIDDPTKLDPSESLDDDKPRDPRLAKFRAGKSLSMVEERTHSSKAREPTNCQKEAWNLKLSSENMDLKKHIDSLKRKLNDREKSYQKLKMENALLRKRLCGFMSKVSDTPKSLPSNTSTNVIPDGCSERANRCTDLASVCKQQKSQIADLQLKSKNQKLNMCCMQRTLEDKDLKISELEKVLNDKELELSNVRCQFSEARVDTSCCRENNRNCPCRSTFETMQSKVGVLTQENVDLRSERATLESELASLRLIRGIVNQLHETVAGQRCRIAELEEKPDPKHFLPFREQIQKLEENNKQLKDQVRSFEGGVLCLSREACSSKRESDEATRKYYDLRDLYGELLKENVTLREENKKHLKEVDNLRGEINTMKDVVKSAEDEVSKLKDEVKELKVLSGNAVKKGEEDYERYQKSLLEGIQALDELRSASQTLKQEKEGLMNKVSELEKENADAKSTLVEAEKARDECKSSLELSEKTMNSLKSTQRKLHNRVDELVGENSKVKTRICILEKERNAAEAKCEEKTRDFTLKLKETRLELEEVRLKYENSLKETNEIVSELEMSNREKSDLETKLTKLDRELGTARGKIGRVGRARGELKSVVVRPRNVRGSSRESSQRSDREHTPSDISFYKQKIDRLERERKKDSYAISKLKNQVRLQKDDLLLVESEKLKLMCTVDQLTNDLPQADCSRSYRHDSFPPGDGFRGFDGRSPFNDDAPRPYDDAPRPYDSPPRPYDDYDRAGRFVGDGRRSNDEGRVPSLLGERPMMSASDVLFRDDQDRRRRMPNTRFYPR